MKNKIMDKPKIGDTVHIYHLMGEDTRYDGAEGIITSIDDAGQLHGTWGGLAIIPYEDYFKIVEEE